LKCPKNIRWFEVGEIAKKEKMKREHRDGQCAGLDEELDKFSSETLLSGFR